MIITLLSLLRTEMLLQSVLIYVKLRIADGADLDRFTVGGRKTRGRYRTDFISFTASPTQTVAAGRFAGEFQSLAKQIKSVTAATASV